MARFSDNAIKAELPDKVPVSFMLLILEQPGQRAGRTELDGRIRYDQMVRFSEGPKSRGC